jgi:hypothetical protein
MAEPWVVSILGPTTKLGESRSRARSCHMAEPWVLIHGRARDWAHSRARDCAMIETWCIILN